MNKEFKPSAGIIDNADEALQCLEYYVQELLETRIQGRLERLKLAAETGDIRAVEPEAIGYREAIADKISFNDLEDIDEEREQIALALLRHWFAKVISTPAYDREYASKMAFTIAYCESMSNVRRHDEDLNCHLIEWVEGL
jgi:hypothetical protein